MSGRSVLLSQRHNQVGAGSRGRGYPEGVSSWRYRLSKFVREWRVASYQRRALRKNWTQARLIDRELMALRANLSRHSGPGCGSAGA